MEQRTNEQLVTLIRAGEDPAGNMLKLGTEQGLYCKDGAEVFRLCRNG